MKYNIHQVLADSITAFDTESVQVISPNNQNNLQNLSRRSSGGYVFSQKETLNKIDMAYNSVYETGVYDSLGQRKSYINIVKFYVKVAVKNTNPNIQDYNFTPTDYSTENMWAIWFSKRQFNNFITKSVYGQTEDELHFDFNKYGSCVSKMTKDDVIRIPLRSLRCDQSAKTLLDGVRGGTPLTIEHNLSYLECKDFPDWEVPKYKGKRQVFEMYTYMSRAELQEVKGEGYDESLEDDMVLTMSIIAPEVKDKKTNLTQEVLFIEETESLPFKECHSEKVDGRWLGVGNVENQLENQVATNISFNTRRRKEMWAAKNIYVTKGDAIGKNFVKEVEDGETLQVGLNGDITRLDTTTRSTGDSTQIENIINDNAQRQSFAFESATGESMTSGTPFRLGAMLSNSVMSYFDGQKEIFGRFRESIYYNQMIPLFKKRAKDDLVIISQTEEGFGYLKQMFVDHYVNKRFNELALSEEIFSKDAPLKEDVIQEVNEKLSRTPSLMVQVSKDVYKNAKYRIKLDLSKKTNPADKESLITLYSEMSRRGDTKRASRLEEIILAQSGIILSNVAGNEISPPIVESPIKNNDLQGLIPQSN